MEKKNHGAEEEIYLAPAETTPEEPETVTAESVTEENVPGLRKAEPKPNVRLGEIPELRGENHKVFRMSDGTEQAVYYGQPVHVFNEETQTYDDADGTLSETADEKHYVGGKGRFTARFSREEDNDELFSIEKGMHRVTVSAKKTKKQKNKGVKPHIRKKDAGDFGKKDVLTFEGVEAGSDYEYSVIGNGVKENIVVKEKADVYRYPFVLHCENVTAQLDEKNRRVAFVSNETGEEVFFIPTPFMTDANGVNSTAVTYALKTGTNGDMVLTVTADSDWLNAKRRAFPVVIDPQILLSGSSGMSTYSWQHGYLYSAAQHTIGTVGAVCDNGDGEIMASAEELLFNTMTPASLDECDNERCYKFVANADPAHIDAGSGLYTIYTEGNIDTVGTLYDSNGNAIACDDDAGEHYNFSITARLNYGETYYIGVREYSGKSGNFSIMLTFAEAEGEDTMVDGCYSQNRLYLSFNMPSLPRNPRIKKAELTFFQKEGTVQWQEDAKLGLYQVVDELCEGYCTPYNDSNLVDYAVMQNSDVSGTVKYTFDVTTLVDKINKGETYYPKLVLKLVDEDRNWNNHVTLYGSASDSYVPQLSVTYESSYGVNTAYRTHTHELGRFGQGGIDLQCGNLMFESEDFVWAGNRMPVTIRHLYNSALYAYQYTKNNSIKLNAANFSAMKLGYGFRLNLMQSMVETGFYHEGKHFNGYVYTGENGEEIYFKESDQQMTCDSDSQCYYLYKDVDDGELVYDPVKLTLTQGEETYLFDTAGRLTRITDSKGNHMDITYTSNRISSVTDGAGRDFDFAYNNSGYLASITAPDDTKIVYTYSGNLLSTVTYPDGKKAKITYSSNKPATVTLVDANGSNVYKVTYSFSGNRLYSVTEYGLKNGSFVVGTTSTYSYSVASARTIVQSTERMDTDEGECYDNVIKTVYTFDDEGNIVSEYVYSEDTGNTGVEGETSGIHPYAGDGGAGVVCNSINLLAGHDFSDLSYWSATDVNCECMYLDNDTAYTEAKTKVESKFGKYLMRMCSYAADGTENGVCQVTNSLPMGQYTFSVYLCTVSGFRGNTTPGAYLRVTTTDGIVLAESEHICMPDSEYVRLCVPFALAAAQSVQVQILMDGEGTVYASAAQLENNPYANAYNMLEHGNFERYSDWLGNNASYMSGTCFNMTHAMRLTGKLDEESYVSQTVDVKTLKTTRETFTLSGWAKGYGLPVRDRAGANAPTFRLRAVVNYGDTVTGESNFETFTADFSPCTEEWQFASVQFAKSKYRTVRNIAVYCDYDYNVGTAYFDAVQMVRDSLETGLSAEDFIEEEIDDTTEVTDENEAVAAEDTAPSFEEVLDAFGNALTETTFTDGEFGTIYRSFAYNTDPDGSGNAGNDLVTETDARGNITTYTVDEDTSRNEEVTDRCGNKTAYEYDASGRTTKVTSKTADGTELAHVSYAYDTFDNLTQIVRGDGMKYVLAYNAYHNLESIGVDGEEEKLVQYTYKTGNGRLKGITYANGDRMSVTYTQEAF